MASRFNRRLRVCLISVVSSLPAFAFAQSPSDHIVKTYDLYCVQCHGVNRDGNGVNSTAMSVKPRDHTDSKAMGDTPDDVLYKAIKGGGLAVGKSVLMPRWEGVLTDAEIKDMVGYLRFVSKPKN